MIIFKNDNKYFCILDNPKCGSSLLREVIYPQIKKNYQIILNNGNHPVRKSGYDHINYVHCNLKGAICFLKTKNINLDNVVFITTIRDPIQRALSSYYYELKIKKKKKWKYNDFTKDILCFLKWNHIQKFYPENFRFYEGYKVDELINLENIQIGFTNLVKKYNLDIDTTPLCKVVNRCTKKITIINEQIISLIKEKYQLDFLDGKYTV